MYARMAPPPRRAAGLCAVNVPERKNPGWSGPGFRKRRLGCGDWIRTSDLRVMSPTSCRCSTPPADGSRRDRFGQTVPAAQDATARRSAIRSPASPAGRPRRRRTGSRFDDCASTPASSDAMMNPSVPAAPNRPWVVDDRPGRRVRRDHRVQRRVEEREARRLDQDQGHRQDRVADQRVGDAAERGQDGADDDERERARAGRRSRPRPARTAGPAARTS